MRNRKAYRLPVVVPILFYNGKHPWTAVKSFAQYQNGYEFFGRHMMDFEYYLVDLTQITDDYILSTNKLIDNILALDKNKQSGSKLAEILEQIEGRLQELTEDEQVSFGKWLEYVLLAATHGEHEESIRLLIEKLKGDAYMMIHGLQEVMIHEYDTGFEKGLLTGIKAFASEQMEMGASSEQIVGKIKKYFDLDEKTARQYLLEVEKMQDHTDENV